MARFSRTFSSLALVFSLAAATSAAAQDKAASTVDLRPRFTTGQTAVLVFDQTRKDVTASPDVPMMNMEIPAHQTVKYRMTVTEASEKSTLIELKIVEIKAESDSKLGSFTYDSTEPADDGDRNNQLLQALKPIVELPIKLRLDETGKIVEVDNAGQGQPRGLYGSLVYTHTSPQAIRMRWSQFLAPLVGDGQATIGKAWTETVTQDAAPVGKFTFVLSSTAAKPEGDTAKVNFSAQMTLGDLSETEKAQFALKDPSLTGSIVWNTKGGFAESYEHSQKMTLDGSAQGMNMTRTSEVVTRITRQK